MAFARFVLFLQCTALNRVAIKAILPATAVGALVDAVLHKKQPDPVCYWDLICFFWLTPLTGPSPVEAGIRYSSI